MSLHKTFLIHLFYITQSVVFLILLLGIIEPQLCSCELFCHSGLGPYIWVHSSLLLVIRFVALSVQHTILYYTILYYTILYYTVSYACAILFSLKNWYNYVYLLHAVIFTTTKVILVVVHYFVSKVLLLFCFWDINKRLCY